MFDIFSKKIGFDLGSAYCSIYSSDKGVLLREASCVVFDTEAQRAIGAGDEAHEIHNKGHKFITIHHPIKRGVIVNYNHAEEMIKLFLEKALGSTPFFKPIFIVSTPTDISSMERRSIIETFSRVGARRVHLVRSSILAALGALIPIDSARASMILDIGAGITDIAIISLGGIVKSTAIRSGGIDIDTDIQKYVSHTHRISIGINTARYIKEEIGSAVRGEEDLSCEVNGIDITTGLPRTITIHTHDIHDIIVKNLTNFISIISQMLKNTPSELAEDIIKNGIVVTGGMAHMRNLNIFINQQTNLKVTIIKKPEYAVINGTGDIIQHLSEYKNSISTKH